MDEKQLSVAKTLNNQSSAVCQLATLFPTLTNVDIGVAGWVLAS
jgi:hypothetical protein